MDHRLGFAGKKPRISRSSRRTGRRTVAFHHGSRARTPAHPETRVRPRTPRPRRMAAHVPDAPPRPFARHLLLPLSRSPRPPHRQDHRRSPRRKKNKKRNIVTENFLDAAFVSFRRLLMDRASLALRGTAILGCALRFSLCRGTISQIPGSSRNIVPSLWSL